MILHTPQPVWRYPYFQIPAILTGLFLILALLTSSLKWFPPSVSVQIMLDLSSSTYQSTNIFRGTGTIMAAEIEAVKEYARQNARAENPILLSLYGFANQVIPITQNFSNNPREIEQSLDRVVQPSIASLIGGGTNLNIAVEKGLESLKLQVGRCKEMLIITDGQTELEENLISQTVNNDVRLNFLIIGQNIPTNLADISSKTGGIALLANVSNIQKLVSEDFRKKFSSNSKQVNFFLGAAFISLMWMLVLPIDRFLQNYRKMPFDWTGRIALFNALFWTVFILLRIGFPFWSEC
jgi:Ca-activated chloride channel family protein